VLKPGFSGVAFFLPIFHANDTFSMAEMDKNSRTVLCSIYGVGVKGRCLQLIYNYLMSIPPASVESERAFSAAGVSARKYALATAIA